jgi:hypothetical protein
MSKIKIIFVNNIEVRIEVIVPIAIVELGLR